MKGKYISMANTTVSMELRETDYNMEIQDDQIKVSPSLTKIHVVVFYKNKLYKNNWAEKC